MMQPLVSIIITNYNYGEFVAQAIQSTLDQTYSSLEVIVVDDGSTDDSIKQIKAFGQRVSLIEQPNQGVVVARNNGAAKAQGEYICFLDADDCLDSEYIRLHIEALQMADDPHVAFAYADFSFFGQLDQVVRANLWNPRKLLYRNYIVVSAVINKKAFVDIGGFATEVNTKASFEDWDLWLSLLEAGYKGVYIPQPLFKYRLHGHGRNGQALQQRASLEHILHQRHPKLYNDPVNKLYLIVMGSASRLRNTLIKPPGT